ncbi:hypothetical protein BDW62DRAFT_196778 [Aspergillus aurantiobrunneus]
MASFDDFKRWYKKSPEGLFTTLEQMQKRQRSRISELELKLSTKELELKKVQAQVPTLEPDERPSDGLPAKSEHTQQKSLEQQTWRTRDEHCEQLEARLSKFEREMTELERQLGFRAWVEGERLERARRLWRSEDELNNLLWNMWDGQGVLDVRISELDGEVYRRQFETRKELMSLFLEMKEDFTQVMKDANREANKKKGLGPLVSKLEEDVSKLKGETQEMQALVSKVKKDIKREANKTKGVRSLISKLGEDFSGREAEMEKRIDALFSDREAEGDMIAYIPELISTAVSDELKRLQREPTLLQLESSAGRAEPQEAQSQMFHGLESLSLFERADAEEPQMETSQFSDVAEEQFEELSMPSSDEEAAVY